MGIAGRAPTAGSITLRFSSPAGCTKRGIALAWVVIFVPVTIGLEILVPERYLLIFIASSLAILPLARWMGDATEQLAAHFGEGVGGLLNATFGNAAELIIALAALRA